MSPGVFDLFKIGIGPSSSHTVGPLRAARLFVLRLEKEGLLDRTARVTCDLFGSLGATGRGHATDRAVVLGLAGETPESVDPSRADQLWAEVRGGRRLGLAHRHEVAFDPQADLVFHPHRCLPFHPNAL
ncbi:MAG TPA: serine dehydratase beta chain, partial [Spirochaetia bacterium]|nr:serine dehydratase beta chain [Spirochaetia bacterium]